MSCVPSFIHKKMVRELINKMRDGKIVVSEMVSVRNVKVSRRTKNEHNNRPSKSIIEKRLIAREYSNKKELPFAFVKLDSFLVPRDVVDFDRTRHIRVVG